MSAIRGFPASGLAHGRPAYAGIGSRETPSEILALMREVGARLAPTHTLRSGGAQGADTAFAEGAAGASGACEIYLPWAGFGDGRGMVYAAQPGAAQAEALAAQFHPAYARLPQGAKKLMARNAMQVLGGDCASPSSFVLCWAKGATFDGDRIANVAGGTGHAVRIAHAHRVRVFNLAHAPHMARIERWLALRPHRPT